MTAEEKKKLKEARGLIFEVEQGWRNDHKHLAAEALFQARMKIDAGMRKG